VQCSDTLSKAAHATSSGRDNHNAGDKHAHAARTAANHSSAAATTDHAPAVGDTRGTATAANATRPQGCHLGNDFERIDYCFNIIIKIICYYCYYYR
jgi:hypothetical protein